MHVPENPPSPQKVLAFRDSKSPLKVFEFALLLKRPLDFFFQRLQQAWYRYQHRNPLPPDDSDHLRRIECVVKDDGRAHQLGQKNSQKLSEHMT